MALLGTALLLLSASHAQELAPDMKIETAAPSGIAGDIEEASPDSEPFLKAGFEFIKWQYDDAERANILKNLVGPDYKERTGRELPQFPNFEFALRNVTGGKYNDVVVWSRLPDDCDENGCKLMVFHLDGDKWRVVARFQAIVVLHRYAPGPSYDERIPEFVAPGDATTPTGIYRWNGTEFVEQ
jgi:hypothetical protein